MKKKHDFDERQQQIVNAQMAKCADWLFTISGLLIVVGMWSEWISGKAWFSTTPWVLVMLFIGYFFRTSPKGVEKINGLDGRDEQSLSQHLRRQRKMSVIEGVGISVVIGAIMYFDKDAPLEFAIVLTLILAIIISYGLYIIAKHQAQKYLQRLNEQNEQ